MSRAGLTNFVFETSNNPGTGAFILNGNPGDRRSFAMGFPNGGQVFYFADDGVMTEWGVGTLTIGKPNVLARTTILGSNSGSLAPRNFTGTVDIYNSLPAERAVWKAEDGALDTDGGMRTNGWYESYTNTYNGVAPESRYILKCDGKEIGRFYGNANSWGLATPDGKAVLLVNSGGHVSAPNMPPDFNNSDDYVITCKWFGRNGVQTSWPHPDTASEDGNVNYLAWSPLGGADGKGGLYATVTAAGQTDKTSVGIVDDKWLREVLSKSSFVNSLTSKTNEARVYGVYYRTDLGYPYLTIDRQSVFNLAKREDMLALQKGKLDLTTYQRDFSTSDSRVINLALEHRMQSFSVSIADGGSIAFPVAFSGVPSSIQLQCMQTGARLTRANPTANPTASGIPSVGVQIVAGDHTQTVTTPITVWVTAIGPK